MLTLQSGDPPSPRRGSLETEVADMPCTGSALRAPAPPAGQVAPCRRSRSPAGCRPSCLVWPGHS